MKIWVAFSYDDGHPTIPLGAYSSPEEAQRSWPAENWTYLPGAFGKGGWSGKHFDGTAFDLIELEVDA